MNCQDIKNKDLIPEYLRGNLSGDQLIQFENHLKSCKSCSNDVELERQLIHGINTYARRSMKNEIRAQVEDLRHSDLNRDWTLISKVAAVLFFITLIPALIYYQYNFEGVFDKNIEKMIKLEELDAEVERTDAPSSYFIELRDKKKSEASKTEAAPIISAPAPEQPTESSVPVVVISTDKGAGMTRVSDLTGAENMVLSEIKTVSDHAELTKKQASGFSATKSMAAKRSIDKKVLPAEEKNAVGNLLGKGIKSAEKDRVQLFYREKYWDLYVLPVTVDENKFSLQLFQTASLNQIRWSLSEELIKFPLNDIQFIAQDESTYISLFPDSTTFQLNLGKEPSAIRIKPVNLKKSNEN